MSAIDVVIAMLKCTCGEAAEWLRARLNFEEPEVVHFDFRTRGTSRERVVPSQESGITEMEGGVLISEGRAPAQPKVYARPRDPLDGFIFDGGAPVAPLPMLIERLLPVRGLAFNGGQSGVGKTFLLCHAAVCLGAGAPFFGYPANECVGSAIFAAEGAITIPNRLTVARQQITKEPKLPVAWLGAVPNLSNPRAIDAMIPRLKALNRHFGDTFGVRLGAVWLDTLAATCDIQDENDNSEASRVARQLQRLSTETETVVVPTHHYGKNQETGLRGASAWRASCDIVWSAIGERNQLTGEIKN